MGGKLTPERIRASDVEPAPAALRNETTDFQSSEVLLEAVTVCITQLMNADSLRDVCSDAAQMIARVVRIDRMVIIEKVTLRTD